MEYCIYFKVRPTFSGSVMQLLKNHIACCGLAFYFIFATLPFPCSVSPNTEYNNSPPVSLSLRLLV